MRSRPIEKCAKLPARRFPIALLAASVIGSKAVPPCFRHADGGELGAGPGALGEGPGSQPLRQRREALYVHDWFSKHRGRKGPIDWLKLDAWIDSSLAAPWEGAKDRWNGITSFFARFRLTGWKRLFNEGLSEALTLGLGGFALLYVLAMPAVMELDEERNLNGKKSVPLLGGFRNWMGET